MDNATRAAKLAEIFGWEHKFELIWPPWNRFGFSTDGLFESGSREFMLEYLLRELNLRGYGVSLDNMTVDGWDAEIRMGADRWWSNSADPLIALVDATIAAHAERREA